jgi:hypothetical protein
LQDHHSTLPFVAKRHELRKATPKLEDTQQRPFRIGMRVDTFADIFRDDLVELGILLVDLFQAVMDNRAQRRLRTRFQQCWNRSSEMI